MAKKGTIQTNLNRELLVKKFKNKRASLKALIADKTLSSEERFAAQLKLAKLPRNSSEVRLRNRCEITGRPRGFYRRFKISRIALREMASFGLLPGVKKSSW
ncbi:MAG: 30S ribosomal protein S14 [Alphaproteobacteria bacterium]|nr:30S ribosomal protein S14 [Alphaproteobacteria bacterium]